MALMKNSLVNPCLTVTKVHRNNTGLMFPNEDKTRSQYVKLIFTNFFGV